MDYVIIGGDERFACLARLLRERGLEVCAARRGAIPGIPQADETMLAGAKNLVVSAASGMPLAGRAPGARIWFCGPGAPEAPGIVDLWSDEALLTENAWLTAEGAVSAAMRAGRRSLRGLPCLVVGWGRIGRALTELLVGLDAEVTAASRSEAHRRRAVERGAHGVATAELDKALPGARLVFNTAPVPVLDGALLRAADPAAMLIDLSSPPYGLDLRAAWALGLRAWREPGLPGRYCPESAAEALLRAMDRRDLHE